jgi:hypothetical protein
LCFQLGPLPAVIRVVHALILPGRAGQRMAEGATLRFIGHQVTGHPKIMP